MLMSAFKSNKRAKRAADSAVAPEMAHSNRTELAPMSRKFNRSDSRRVAALVSAAHEKLKPLASIDFDATSCGAMSPQVVKHVDNLGGTDGVGSQLLREEPRGRPPEGRLRAPWRQSLSQI